MTLPDDRHRPAAEPGDASADPVGGATVAGGGAESADEPLRTRAGAFDPADRSALIHLRALTNVLGDAVAVTDADSRVLAWNAAAAELYGIDAADAIGARIYDLFDSTSTERPLAREEPRRLTIEHGEWRGRTIDVPRIGRFPGRQVPVDAVLSRLSDAGGAFSGIISVKRDATLLEQASRRVAAERALARRLETLHELTAVGLELSSVEVLAARTARLVNGALEATGTAFGLFDAERSGYRVSHAVELPAALEAWLRRNPPIERGVVNRWLAGAGSVLAGFEPAEASPGSIEAARASGVAAYAAIPLRVDDELVGGMVAYFRELPSDLPIQLSDLDAVGRIASIALSNLELRSRLGASEARYRTLFERSPVPFVLETLDGRVADVNQAALELYRADRTWLVGRSVDEISDWQAGELARRRAAMTGAGHGTFRGVGVRADGTHFPQEVYASTVEVDGEVRVLVRVEDLTEHDRLQTELVQAQKMEAIGQLVAGVAHELNNPLASIVAFSQLMRRDERLPDDMRRDADLLVAEADRTRRIVQNLLDFARQRRPERHPTPLHLLVRSVLDLQSYSISAWRIDVRLDVPESLPLVSVDRAQMQQVLLNLTLNAIQAIRDTGRPGSIRISARREDDGGASLVRLVVADDGPGVAPEHRGRLFDPFFTTKAPGEGTGLGLPVSFGIVTAHGGSLSFEPGPGERGATFTVTLPIADPTLADAPGLGGSGMAAGRHGAGGRAGTADAGAGGVAARTEKDARPAAPVAPGAPEEIDPAAAPVLPARILVLDDEPSIRAFLAKVLRAAGFEPTVVGGGDEAIEAVVRTPFDAVLCDYRMAGMTGTEVYERLVAARPELAGRVVFMSGDVLNADLAAFAARNDIGLLAKPFDIETVQSTVQAIIAARRDP